MKIEIHYQEKADPNHTYEYTTVKFTAVKFEFEETEMDYALGSKFEIKVWICENPEEDPIYVRGEKLLYFYVGPENSKSNYQKKVDELNAISNFVRGIPI